MKEIYATNHPEQVVCCPQCKQKYINQHGGQKSGSSPAVHVIHEQRDEKGTVIQPAQTIGYCSVLCLYKTNGWDYQEYINTMNKMGVSVDPPGYLSPSRRLK